MAESWGKIIAGLIAGITGGKSSIPDDEEPQADFPFNTIHSVRIDGSTTDHEFVTNPRLPDKVYAQAHPFKAGHSGMTCVQMVTVKEPNGSESGDACGLPANHPMHDDPVELRESPLVHIGCVTECITGDPECPGIRLTQMMNQKNS